MLHHGGEQRGLGLEVLEDHRLGDPDARGHLRDLAALVAALGELGAKTALGRFLRGDPQHDTDGTAIGHGRSYELFSAVAFGGRRDQVFTRLAALSGARPGRPGARPCGTGCLTQRMTAAVTPGGTPLGIDPSDQVIEHARRLAADRPGCTFERGIAEQLEAPDASFDVVVSSLMVHHLPARPPPGRRRWPRCTGSADAAGG
ncbi:class I SAM-dependent methyltransferase [Streptomyces rhizosphaericus]|uniref:class I SAM-dependent methyltransferase n=2 Tax=Streptomyces violaceusniger group TaxID=2839105 RepID=UPI0023EAA458|nr:MULTISPECIES: class I SAM-dependent methyltransferase [Streptomyces violaceusniger group]